MVRSIGLPGVKFRPALFEPTFHKHVKVPCGGCQVHITDRRSIEPVLTGVALLQAFRRAAPSEFKWREPPYEYEHRLQPIDILAGSSDLRERIERNEEALEIARGWKPSVDRFLDVRERFLLY